GRHCRNETTGARIAQDLRAKLLIDQYAGPVLRHAGAERKFKCVVYDVLCPGDPPGLVGSQRARPTIEAFFEGAAMVKGQDVQRFIISDLHVVALAYFQEACTKSRSPQRARSNLKNASAALREACLACRASSRRAISALRIAIRSVISCTERSPIFCPISCDG